MFELSELLSHEGESDIKIALTTHLRKLDRGSDWETEKTLNGNRCDIISVASKTIIEVKRKGVLRGRYDKKQLIRYVRSAIQKYDNVAFGAGESIPWRAILTDGKGWACWDFDSYEDSLRLVADLQVFGDEESIGGFIQSRIIDRWKGIEKIRIPSIQNLVHKEFKLHLRGLLDLVRRVGATTGYRTKFELWKNVLRGSGIVPGGTLNQIELFTRHTFIVIVSKLIVAWVEKVLDEGPVELVGDGFHSWVIEHLEGQEMVRALYGEIKRYQWQLTGVDVLKYLYHALIDAENRKEFGEFYTPDELARDVVAEVLDDSWLDDAIRRAYDFVEFGRDGRHLGVLDPSCGSGTFLFHAAKRIVARIKREHKLLLGHTSKIVARLVHGIDIHPVAVEMSKATLRMALPSSDKLELRVCWGDAMQQQIGVNGYGIEVTIPTAREGYDITLGKRLLEHPKLFELVDEVNEAILGNRSFPEYRWEVKGEDSSFKEDALSFAVEYERFCLDLSETIRDQGDRVWTSYVKNFLRIRGLLDSGVGRIVGNPPWQVRNNAEEGVRKRLIRNLAKLEGVYTRVSGYLANVDLAKVLTARAIRLYLGDRDLTNKYGWVLPESAIINQAWKNWRSGQWTDMVVSHYEMWNLETSPPIFEHAPNGCSVVLGRKTGDRLPLRVLNYRGDYFSDELEVSQVSFLDAKASVYYEGLKNGVIYRPVCYYQVLAREDLSGGLSEVITQKGTKRQWKAKGLDGMVESDVLWPLIDSRHLKRLNYKVGMWLLAPLDKDTGKLMLNDPKRNRVYPKLHAYWDACQQEYDRYRNRERSSLSLETNYGFNKSLEDEIDQTRRAIGMDVWDMDVFRNSKESLQRRKVVYNSSGTTLKAIRIPLNCMTNSKLYYLICESEQEAKYLVGIINAPDMQPIWRATKTSKMHYHMSPLKGIPVPKFDPENAIHNQIVDVIDALEKEDSSKPVFTPLNPIVRKLLMDTFNSAEKHDSFLIIKD